jgi:hypothetical protein
MVRWRNFPEFHKAFDHPRVRELRGRLAGHPDVGPKRADLFIERMIVGFMHQAGDVHAADFARRLEQLFDTRIKLSESFEAVLDGQKISPETVRKLFGDMDEHMAALLESPAERLKKQGGPQLPQGLPANVWLPRAGGLRVALGDLMPHFEKLPAEVRDALGFAAERYPEQLRKVIRAETVEAFTREIGELDKLLAREGMDINAFRRLNEGIETLQRQALSKHEVADAMLAWARSASLPEPLRSAVHADPRLLAFVNNPQMLQDLFAAFHRKPRGYPFYTYVKILQSHVRGALGEFEASFRLGDDFHVLKGPEGGVTVAGTDLVVVNIKTGEVHIIDNKAFTTREQVDAVSALTSNLPKNLTDDIAAFQSRIGGRPDVPITVQAALKKLEDAQAELASLGITSAAKATSAQQPTIAAVLAKHGINREVTGAAGIVDRVSAALQAIGIELRDVNK